MSEFERPEIDACWNRIGVYGDSSCPQLTPHVHCRNCPVFSAAAARLLDWKLPDGHLEEWARHFARPRQVEAPDTDSIVIFRVAAEWLALPTRAFEEIADPRAIHTLPDLRDGTVLGLVNVRGELLICASLVRLLALDSTAAAPRDARRMIHPRFLVLRLAGARFVFPADQVLGVQRFRPSDLQAPPATVARAAVTYTRALLHWQGRSVGVLDDELLGKALERSLSHQRA